MYWQRYPDGHPVLHENERTYLKAVTGPGGEVSRGVLKSVGLGCSGRKRCVMRGKRLSRKV